MRLNKLKKKLDEKRYVLTYGGFEERMHGHPKELDLWEWTQEIDKILGEL